MPLEFVLTPAQQALQADARAFAREELSRTKALTEHLPTPELRFAATRPIYEKAIAAGFLNRLIPQSFGGGGTGLMDMAVVAEEFYAVDVNVSLTLFANLLGLMPLFLAGTPEQLARFLPPFLDRRGAPLAALANSEPAGSANFMLPAPFGTRTTARLEGDSWVVDGEKHWISSATGWDTRGADLLCVVCRTSTPEGLTILAVPRPAQGLTLVQAADTVGHRAHLVPRFRMDGVRVPLDHAIGGAGQGRALVDASFTGTAALVGIMAVGAAARSLRLRTRFRQDAASRRAATDHPASGCRLRPGRCEDLAGSGRVSSAGAPAWPWTRKPRARRNWRCIRRSSARRPPYG